MHASPSPWRSLVTLLILLMSVANVIADLSTLGVLRPEEEFILRWKNNDGQTNEAAAADMKTFFYNQTLDHFNYLPQCYATFRQKYILNTKYWSGSGKNKRAPIFAYLGAEAPLDGHVYAGVLQEKANQFNALLVWIEHRYYGDSIPFSSVEEAFSNATTLGYFNSAQAIADYAEVLIHIKKKFNAHNSPIIVVGGSYGGMLAAWFRLKYPHIVLGALASSAPVLYFDDITPSNAFAKVITKDFQDASMSCYKTIKKSWDEIDRVASLPNGLANLSQKFNTCSPVTDVFDVKNAILRKYVLAAQYSFELVESICQGIDRASKDTDIITRIKAGTDRAAFDNSSCLSNHNNEVYGNETIDGWSWQLCTEIVMPKGRGNETMLYPLPFNLTEYIQSCQETYGVQPRPHWVTTYYGGNDMKLVFRRFGSNIIFSNGLRDPFSSGGVLEDLSESLVAIKTENGTHCMDLIEPRPNDPKWLVKQREKEAKVIEGWLHNYYNDLGNPTN